MEHWPVPGDRYDPYDPAHPMWSDPFWSRYGARPGAPATPAVPAAAAPRVLAEPRPEPES